MCLRPPLRSCLSPPGARTRPMRAPASMPTHARPRARAHRRVRVHAHAHAHARPCQRQLLHRAQHRPVTCRRSNPFIAIGMSRPHATHTCKSGAHWPAAFNARHVKQVADESAAARRTRGAWTGDWRGGGRASLSASLEVDLMAHFPFLFSFFFPLSSLFFPFFFPLFSSFLVFGSSIKVSPARNVSRRGLVVCGGEGFSRFTPTLSLFSTKTPLFKLGSFIFSTKTLWV